MPHAKPLELDLAAELLEMLGQQLLLGLHAGRAAGPRPDRAELLQILVRPGAVEGDVFQLQRRGRRGAAIGPAVAEQQPTPPPPRRRSTTRWSHARENADTTDVTDHWTDMRIRGANDSPIVAQIGLPDV